MTRVVQTDKVISPMCVWRDRKTISDHVVCDGCNFKQEQKNDDDKAEYYGLLN